MADNKPSTFFFGPSPTKSEPKKSTFDFGPSSTAIVKTNPTTSSSNGIFSNAGYELWTFPKPVSPPDSHHSSSASSPQLSRSPSPAPPLKLHTAPPSPPKSTQPLASSSQISTAPAPAALFPPQASPWPVASASASSSQASPAPASPTKLFAAPEPSSQAAPAPASPTKLFTAPKPSPQASQVSQASAPAPPSKAPAATSSTQLVPASAPLIKFSAPKDVPAPAPPIKFNIPKDLSFGKMSFNKLSLSDSSTNSDTSSPEAIQESHVQTPASAISEPDDMTMDTSLESMFLTVKTQQNDEIKTSPLLTLPPLETAPPSHYGLLGVDSRAITKAKTAPKNDQEAAAAAAAAPPSLSASRIFHNVAAPSSTFICGSQGSGKSNTLACLLENCLLPNKYGVLPKPLTGIVFHYDGFNSDAGGLICEAACLASDKRIRVRVVCAPTNIKTIRHTYRNVPGVIIEPLQLRDSHLNTSRMLDLMAVGETNVPLYMRVVGRVLRELRLEQQETGGYFNYQKFKSKMDREDLTDMQRAPLNQRLDTLESFMVQTGNSRHRTNKYAPVTGGNDWTPKAGQLTIVDLSCPCVTAEMACSLFNICLHLFVEGTSPIGRVIALDEAHKYMTMGPESRTLTDNLLGIIRLQRHLGARIIISTQEPTVSPKLLDLCSVTIVHRFTSPDWLRTLQGHLAGVSYMSAGSDESGALVDEADLYRGAVKPLALGGKNAVMELFAKIVSLRTGEALVFSPSAIIDLRGEGDAQPDDIDTKAQVIRLAHRALRVQVRTRLTLDGGRSVMAA